MRWLRAPLVHFVVGGALLFRVVHGVLPLVASAAPSPEPVVVTASDVERLRSDYVRETGLEPTAEDEVALVDHAIEEELLFREALARGLDRNDRSVRNWLVEQMHVLDGAPANAADDGLYDRARALGLDRSDLVVRRILVQNMRLLVGRVDERLPTDGELEAYYESRRDEYRTPERVTFWQVFVSADRHGDATLAVAGALLDGFRRAATAPAEAARRGDSFTVMPHVVAQPIAQVTKLLGASAGATVAHGPTGEWLGPVRSPYGAHLLWIESREAGAAPSFALVRGRLLERWRDEQRAVRVSALVRDLKHRHPLAVESGAWRARSTS